MGNEYSNSTVRYDLRFLISRHGEPHKRDRRKRSLSFPARENTALMSLMGNVTVNGNTNAAALDFILFENDGEDITVDSHAGAHLLLLNGEPIDEPVVQSGPFVMNTEGEIRQAMMDFRNGKFGRLE